MKILILGAYGQLGHKLLSVLAADFDVRATCRALRADVPGELVDRRLLLPGVEAEDADSVVGALAGFRPDVVINCIGIVKQRGEAKDPLPSIGINALFPHRLAQLCRFGGARLIHFSTDCVFSGRQGNYREDDESDAQDLYGRTKYLGEVAGPGCLTIRSSFIGPELGSQTALLGWFIRNRGGRVNGYRGAIYSGLTTLEMAAVVRRVIAGHPDLSGVWHVASEPISKYDLLVQIDRRLELGIAIDPEDAFRCDRSLDGTRFRSATGYRAPPWEALIEDLARDCGQYGLLPHVSTMQGG